MPLSRASPGGAIMARMVIWAPNPAMTLAWVFHAAFADDSASSEGTGAASRRTRMQTHAQTQTQDAATQTDATRERLADPDASLIPQIRAGDERSFDNLYRRFYAPLVGFAMHYGIARALAEEMVQETFLGVWRTRATWDVRGTVREYIFGAVRNRVLDYRRHERVIDAAGARVGAQAVAGVAQRADAPDTLVTDAELRSAVDAELARMPEERRQVLVLRWQEDLSYPEIAAILGISVNAAKQQGSRAQRALRALLERFHP